MLYIILTAVLVSLAVISFCVAKWTRKRYETSSENDDLIMSKIAYGGSAILICIWLVLIPIFSYHAIPAGSVGIVYTFGGITGQISEGANFIMPFRSVVTANIQVQSHPFLDLGCFSLETQEVLVDATLNLKVSPVAVQTLYRTVGTKWFDILVAPRVKQIFKDEIVKYSSVEVAPHREEIRHNVGTRLRTECEAYS